MLRENKNLKNNLVIETLSFLNEKVDNIIGKTELINELLEVIDDVFVTQLLSEKLDKLEEEIDYIGKKIELEQKNLKKA